MNVCPCCGGKTRDGLMCAACWNALRRDLRTVPALLADLITAASKQARLTPPTPGGLASERNPVGWHAADAKAVLCTTVITWARDIGVKIADVGPYAPRIGTAYAAIWLENQADRIRAHPQAAQLWEQITAAIHQARRAIDRPEHRAIIDVAPCPEPCPGHLRAYIPHDDTPARVTCTTNPDHQWTADQWLRLGRRILATKGPAA